MTVPDYDASIVLSLAPWAAAVAVSLVVMLVYLAGRTIEWWRARHRLPVARVRRYRGRR